MKRRILCILLLFCLLLSACAGEQSPAEAEAPEESQPAAIDRSQMGQKIALVSTGPGFGLGIFPEEEQENIIPLNWAEQYPWTPEELVDSLQPLLKNEDVGAIIFDPTIEGMDLALEEAAKQRPELLRILCLSSSRMEQPTAPAELRLEFDAAAQARRIVEKAEKMGAESLVYYEYGDQLDQPIYGGVLAALAQTCGELGIRLLPEIIPYAMRHDGHQFVTEDIPEKIAQYGEKTAFTSSGSRQSSILAGVLEHGGLYLGTLFPRPSAASAMESIRSSTREEDEAAGNFPGDMIEARQQLREKGPDGRIADFPISYLDLELRAAYEYAKLWLAGELPEQGVDKGALLRIMEEISGGYCYVDFAQEDGEASESHILYYMEPQLVEWE